MIKWTVTTTVLMAFIIAVLSLFWGVFNHADANLEALVVYVADFDGQVAPYNNVNPVVGPIITQMAQNGLKQSPHLGWEVHDASFFNGDPLEARRAVYDWDCWAAIIINPNATALLQDAIRNGNTSYDPNGALQLVYTDSRDDTNWYDFLNPLIRPFMSEVVAKVGEEWAKSVMQDAVNDQALVRNARQVPQAISPAVGFSEYNLRPFYPYTAIPAVSIGLIYLIIMSFFSFSFYLPIHFKVRPFKHCFQIKLTFHSTSNPKAILLCTSGSSLYGAGAPRSQPTSCYR